MHILQFGYIFKVITVILSKMTCFHESLYIQYSISDDIVITHILHQLANIIAEDM